MQDENFEWDDEKAARNWRDHGVSFEMARDAFRDLFAVERVDTGQDQSEERYAMIAMVEGRILFVAYSCAASASGLFRPAGRSLSNDGNITMKTGKHDWQRFDTLSEADAHAAALKDGDAQPLSDASLARMKPVPRARTLRRALGLTQEEFAARYRIPIGTLRDWEQGRSAPDQPARAYLTVIAHDPEGVRRALETRPGLDAGQ